MPGTNDVSIRWAGIPDESLTTSDIESVLSPCTDDLWVAAACTDRLVDSLDVQRALLDLGIARTAPALARAQAAVLRPANEESEVGEKEKLEGYLRDKPADARVVWIRVVLLERLDRLNAFVKMKGLLVASDEEEEDEEEREEGEEVPEEDWEDDPWATEDSGDPASPTKARHDGGAAKKFEKEVESPIPLSQFLSDDLLESAQSLASLEQYAALGSLLQSFSDLLWPYRLVILESIPEYAHPSDYSNLLPKYDLSADKETSPSHQPPHRDLDPTESSLWRQALATVDLPLPLSIEPTPTTPSQPEPLSAASLAAWYKSTTDRIVSSTGMVDIALELVQHGASQGIPALDLLGEDLSLLSRVVYDAPRSQNAASAEDWTLDHWRALTPADAVRAYVSHSTPNTLANDIRALVLPHLFVLEARAERAGQPDPDLPVRAIEEYVLSAPLELAQAVFEASKPTMPVSQRLVKDEPACVRLALAVLYGSNQRDAWGTMSAIFECLPAWDDSAADDEGEAADTVLTALGSFVAPTTQRAAASPAELLAHFKPLPRSALSRALDVLDVHLESGEILARWGVPAPLRWFLQAAGDVAEQRKWATRMARQAEGLGERVDTEDEWEGLLGDMLKLTGRGDGGIRGAFGLLERGEVIRIFFGGVLSAGDFEVARSLLRKTKSKLSLDAADVENICLSCSREFYDNASSGNYKVGDMKLAYDCLDIPPSSEAIIKEKEFIEATSRICSFNVMSRPGIPISPIEVRLTKDRLSLVSRVLSSTPDAYKHTQVLLELADKLGYRDDPAAETTVLAMVADSALQAEDFTRASEACERMVSTVLALPRTDSRAQAAAEVCWVACFQLGRQQEFADSEKKLTLLGRALELCPADRLPDILVAWRKLEAEHLARRQERVSERRRRRRAAPSAPDRVRQLASALGTPLSASSAASSAAASIASRLQGLQGVRVPSLPGSPLVHAPEAAALASKTLSRVAANFPFGRRDRSVDSARTSSPDPAGRARAEASRALQKGIGWLIGSDE